jgi:hypothetical protein
MFLDTGKVALSIAINPLRLLVVTGRTGRTERTERIRRTGNGAWGAAGIHPYPAAVLEKPQMPIDPRESSAA